MIPSLRDFLGIAVGWLLGLVPVPVVAQHSHINAGAREAVPGAPLFFANGSQFEAASGYLIHLRPETSASYGPIFIGGSDVTFTSLAAFPDNGGPIRYAALPGTRVEAVFETLHGPEGGALSFWDSGDGFFDATEITFTVPVGTIAGTNRFALSENDGSSGADPYGHIHGRKFSVNLPGVYVAGFRLVDAAPNGVGGGPNHAPSELTSFAFLAGVVIARVDVTTDGVVVRFGSESGRTYFVEATSQLGSGARWQTVAGPIAGTGRMLASESLSRSSSPTFFRLRIE